MITNSMTIIDPNAVTQIKRHLMTGLIMNTSN